MDCNICQKYVRFLEGTLIYLEGICMYIKHKNVFLMVNRYILKVFESYFNAFGCIYSVLHYIGSIFQCI
jgi:hypothetical protein